MTNWYIKSGRDYETRILKVISYDVITADIFGETSIITAINDPDIRRGDIVAWNNIGWMVDTITPECDGGTMEITCQSLDKLFERPVYALHLSFSQGISAEAAIYLLIQNQYAECTDPLYAKTYIQVEKPTSETILTPPETGKYSLDVCEYIRQCRRFGVNTTYSVERKNLAIKISANAPLIHTIDLTGYQATEVYATEPTAKISSYTSSGVVDYYLMADGSITSTPGEGTCIEGAWRILEDADEDRVLQEFQKNESGHLVEFAHTKKMELLDVLRIKTPSGRIVDSFVSSIRQTSQNPHMYQYKCGEVTENLTLKLKQQEV